LTHHHYDHVAGAAAVAARTGAPIVAHARTAKLLANGPKVDRTVDDGECWQAGAVGRVRGIFTPGHAPGHMAFLCERMGLLLAGDLVAGVGTVIVDPVDGDMIDYLDSLKRVSSLGIRTIIPAHGPAIFGAEAALEDLLEHRYFREAKIVEALGRAGRAGPPTLEAILPEVYDDTPERQWPLAARSLDAHLIKLEREGRIERKGGAIRLLA
jgi:glyoxylase-like metal-dependent hydrolase (beta-lactamase superfamily II)